jgi:hypothetical protein
MERNNKFKDSNELKAFKNQIGFGMAFKATLGFYAAQAVATLVGLLIIGTVIAALVYLLG